MSKNSSRRRLAPFLALAFSAVSVGLTAMQAAGQTAAPTPEVRLVDALMTAWHRAAATADAKTYFGLMAPGSIFLGTDVTERWTKEELEAWAAPRFKGPSAWTYRAVRRAVKLSVDGRTAWVDEDLESKSYWPCRGTAVLEHVDGAWKIRLYALALTIPNDAVPEIRAAVMRHFPGAAR